MSRSFAIAAAMLLAGCATSPHSAPAAPDYPEARAYGASDDATGDVDAALARAQASGKRVILALGADWCHDSRAFAGWLETPRFRALTERAFEVVHVDVGMPQTGKVRNPEVARRFGFATLEGTPTVLVLDSDGTVLNAETARAWRNTASRSGDAIYTELERYAPPAG